MSYILKIVIEILAGMLLSFIQLELRVKRGKDEIDDAVSEHEKAIEESKKLGIKERRKLLIEAGREFIAS